MQLMQHLISINFSFLFFFFYWRGESLCNTLGKQNQTSSKINPSADYTDFWRANTLRI